MYGWRARIGLVIPTNNIVIEPEFGILAPSAVSSHAARIMAGGMTPEGISRMVENSFRAVEELRAGDMSVIAYACLATSLVKGVAFAASFHGNFRIECVNAYWNLNLNDARSKCETWRTKYNQGYPHSSIGNQT